MQYKKKIHENSTQLLFGTHDSFLRPRRVSRRGLGGNQGTLAEIS